MIGWIGSIHQGDQRSPRGVNLRFGLIFQVGPSPIFNWRLVKNWPTKSSLDDCESRSAPLTALRWIHVCFRPRSYPQPFRWGPQWRTRRVLGTDFRGPNRSWTPRGVLLWPGAMGVAGFAGARGVGPEEKKTFLWCGEFFFLRPKLGPTLNWQHRRPP